MYLGTPQTKDSIYNRLPQRGFAVRIWPGRFPTDKQQKAYGEHLAPSIVERMGMLGDRCRTGGGLDGSRGWPTDPHRFNEADLCDKELDQGPETFELQFMLNTALMDALRQQLKIRDLIVGDFAPTSVPEVLTWAADPRLAWPVPPELGTLKPEFYRPASMSEVFRPLTDIVMCVDPASDGGDELAFAVGGVVGPYLHVLAWGGFRGGFADANLEKLVDVVKEFSVKRVVVEKNMGAGAVTRLIQNYFNGLDERGKKRVEGVGITDANATGQKERRIIDTIRPILQRHRLVLHKRALDMDIELLQQYPMDRRLQYSGLFQLQNITTDRGSLAKDDRVDVLEQLCRSLVDHLAVDEDKAKRHREKEEARKFLDDPMGYGKRGAKPKSSVKALRRRVR
jgi:hypothetical protein